MKKFICMALIGSILVVCSGPSTDNSDSGSDLVEGIGVGTLLLILLGDSIVSEITNDVLK